MLILLYISVILIGLFAKKSRIVSIYIITIDIVIAAFKYDVADMGGYVNQYIAISRGLTDVSKFKYPGFYYLQLLFTKIGMSQQQWFVAFYLLCLMVLYFSVKRITRNINVVLSVFSLYPFAIEAIQMKQFLGDVLALYALTFLIRFCSNRKIDNKQLKNVLKKKDIIIFGVLSLLAASIQFSTAFFLIVGVYFIFVNREKMNRYNLIAVILAVILVRTGALTPILRFINSYYRVLDLNYSSQFLQSKVGMGILIPIICVICIMLLDYLGIDAVYESSCDIHTTKSFLSTSVLVVALINFGFIYFRLFRVYAILELALIANQRGRKYNNLFRMIIFSLLFAILFSVEVLTYYDTTLGPMLTNNSLIH